MFADAFFVAFRIPNLLRSFIAEGALTSAFVPVFSSSLSQGRASAQATLSRICGFLLCLTVPITALGILFAPEVIHFMAPGFAAEGGKLALAISLTRWMMPYIVCVSLIALLNSALNACGIFGASAWAQIIMNVVLIIGALCATPFLPHTATLILAISVLVGGIAQLVAQIPACRRADLSCFPTIKIFSADVGEVIKLMLPATIGASVYQLSIFFSTILASFLAEGSVSWLFYADRVAQFPIGIFSIALASVLLPALSRASASADSADFTSNLANSLRYTSFLIIPMSAGIWVLSLPIVRLLFERGEFSFESSVRTSQALQALVLGLWATSCHSMIVRAFIAKKDTITPTVIGAFSLIVSLFFSLLLMGPILYSGESLIAGILQKSQNVLQNCFPWVPPLGHVGLALASSISAFSSLALVLLFFRTAIGRFPWSAVLPSTFLSLASAAVMIFTVQPLISLVTAPLLQCLIAVFAGGFVYAGLLFLARSRELAETTRLVGNVLRREATRGQQGPS
jgi:putative peptidoglycan lipid II flippase